MIAVQFQTVGDDTLYRSIAGIGPLDSSMAGYDSDYNFATELKVWDPARQGYTTYGWSGTSGTDIDDDDSYDNQWLDFDTEITSDEVVVSDGFWVNAEKSGVMTISGQVPALTSDLTVNLVKGFNIVANPYPQAIKIAEFGSLDDSFSGYDSDYNFATELKVWDPARQGYTTYGWSGTSGTDIDDDDSYDHQWLDFDTEITTDEIPMGSAVWINAEKAGVITFKKL